MKRKLLIVIGAISPGPAKTVDDGSPRTSLPVVSVTRTPPVSWTDPASPVAHRELVYKKTELPLTSVPVTGRAAPATFSAKACGGADGVEIGSSKSSRTTSLPVATARSSDGEVRSDGVVAADETALVPLTPEATAAKRVPEAGSGAGGNANALAATAVVAKYSLDSPSTAGSSTRWISVDVTPAAVVPLIVTVLFARRGPTRIVGAATFDLIARPQTALIGSSEMKLGDADAAVMSIA